MSYYGNYPENACGGRFYGDASSNMTSTTRGDRYAATANVQAWQASTLQQQQQQQQHSYHTWQQQRKQTKQQQQASAAFVWGPAIAAAISTVAGSVARSSTGFFNDAVINSVSAIGESFFKEGMARMIPGLESTMLLLQSYFAVDNRYVFKKTQKVLFPFTSRYWHRQVRLKMN